MMSNPLGWTSLVQKNVLDENGDSLTPRGAMAVESPDGSVTVELVDDATDKVTRIKLSAGPGQGLRPVRLAATGNIANLANAGLSQDSVTVGNGDRILLPFQTDQTENGVYVGTIVGEGLTLTRAADMAAGASVLSGLSVPVQAGTLYGGTSFRLLGDGAFVVGTDALDFSGDLAIAGEVSLTTHTSYTMSDAFSTTDATPHDTAIATVPTYKHGHYDITVWASGAVPTTGASVLLCKRLAVEVAANGSCTARVDNAVIGDQYDGITVGGLILTFAGTPADIIATTTGKAGTNITWSLKVDVLTHLFPHEMAS